MILKPTKVGSFPKCSHTKPFAKPTFVVHATGPNFDLNPNNRHLVNFNGQSTSTIDWTPPNLHKYSCSPLFFPRSDHFYTPSQARTTAASQRSGAEAERRKCCWAERLRTCAARLGGPSHHPSGGTVPEKSPSVQRGIPHENQTYAVKHHQTVEWLQELFFVAYGRDISNCFVYRNRSGMEPQISQILWEINPKYMGDIYQTGTSMYWNLGFHEDQLWLNLAPLHGAAPAFWPAPPGAGKRANLHHKRSLPFRHG